MIPASIKREWCVETASYSLSTSLHCEYNENNRKYASYETDKCNGTRSRLIFFIVHICDCGLLSRAGIRSPTVRLEDGNIPGLESLIVSQYPDLFRGW
jgi:hypothetical protein